MTTDTPRPAKSRAGADQLAQANAKRQLDAAIKAAAEVRRRLRHLDDETLAKLIEVAQFEALIRSKAGTNCEEVGGSTT